MKRRDLLKAMLACGMAPTIVKASSIMSIKPPELGSGGIIVMDGNIVPPELGSGGIIVMDGNIVLGGTHSISFDYDLIPPEVYAY